MRVIGTAGHVDHGKSTLVQAITGTHPDRLKEEKAREMTIDLGFAFYDLENGEEVGIVDVPGHRDFIENMLSGIGGIDAVIFVIAADEGVMPQTREHLSIINLLKIKKGVIALTKIDLVEDPDWLELIEEDIRGLMIGTVMETAPIIRTSSKTMAGIGELKKALGSIITSCPQRQNIGLPRLPIDRIFSSLGFGTVVTGTLIDGSFAIGDALVVLPSEKEGRVRGLETHNQKETEVHPGTRIAINISGVGKNEIERGEWVVHPGDYKSTRRLDLTLDLLPDVSNPMKHNVRVKFFLGAAEVAGRLRLLGTDQLLPGESAYIQVELAKPVVAVRGDRYILRRPSPSETLGGGVVVDPFPPKRHKRFDEKILKRLVTFQEGSPEDMILEILQSVSPMEVKAISERSRFDLDQTILMVNKLVSDGRVIKLPDNKDGIHHKALVMGSTSHLKLSTSLLNIVEIYHEKYPMRMGIPKEELRSSIRLDPSIYNKVISLAKQEGLLDDSGATIHLPTHSIKLSLGEKLVSEQLISRMKASPFETPANKEIQAEIGSELFRGMIELGMIVPVSGGVVFDRDTYERLIAITENEISINGGITVAQFRDKFSTTRKYALGFLEHLDEIGLTKRQGDIRILPK